MYRISGICNIHETHRIKNGKFFEILVVFLEHELVNRNVPFPKNISVEEQLNSVWFTSPKNSAHWLIQSKKKKNYDVLFKKIITI